jgi:propionyl-CoA carboxylase alpha chain/3-methylcrotonyl-CoA carboxylase alpha subunit
MFKRILIANRGEIACRVARTCRAMGVEYGAVYSEADVASPHLEGASAAVLVGPGPALQSYLDGARIIEAALRNQCEAIHPGYGFLSENSRFAEDVQAAGLVFIGPRPETIAALGDKARAKALMQQAGVPVVPGGGDASDDPRIVEQMVEATGLPVLLKPSAGGGGKGMQVLSTTDGMREVIEGAIRVARSSFGDGRLIVERFVEQPRHIEVQVFGDTHGNIVHLFERECSLQRRHQKVIEEAPAATLPPSVREELLRAAVQGAGRIGYLNAGTFEFIVGKDHRFYFLEVNTRLQVEHPVTECITGLDLVEWQLRVAAGEPLPLAQEAIVAGGHAVECRLYAEDPAAGFAPAPGMVDQVIWPAGIRVEAGILPGGQVPPYYDPMVAKLVAHARDRADALKQLGTALRQTVLLGLTTNTGYLQRVLADQRVLDGDIHTRYLDEQPALLAHPAGPARAAAAAAFAEADIANPLSSWSAQGLGNSADRAALDPSAPLGQMVAWAGGAKFTFPLRTDSEGRLVTEINGKAVLLSRFSRQGRLACGQVGSSDWFACLRDGIWEVQLDGDRYLIHTARTRTFERAAEVGAAIAPMSGAIVSLHVQPGDAVQAGDALVIMEAMKMEHRIVASVAGKVMAVPFSIGDGVKQGDLLVDIEAAS